MSGQATSAETPESGTRHGAVFLIYFLVVMYALCYQLQSPLEPFLVESLIGKDNASEVAVSYARLQSFFSVIQMVGSLTFGYILDRFGVRIGFLINFSGCALTYLILSNTSSIEMLFLSKVPGVAMAGFLCAQTAVSQLTPSGPERVAALGRLTTAYTIGGVVGPYIGGQLGAQGDYFLSAKIATAGSIIAALLSLTIPVTTKAHDPAAKEPSSDLPWASRAKLVLKLTGLLIFVKLITGTANSMASSSQSLILKNELGFSEADLGTFMSSQFAFGGLANAFLLAPVTVFLGGKAKVVVRNCVAIMALGYCLQACLAGGAAHRYFFIAVSMGMSVFQYSLMTSITAESTSVVSDDMKGTLIGMEHCIFSGARILTPAIGIGIMNSYGTACLYGCCACIFVTVLIMWQLFSAKLLPDKVAKPKHG